MTKPTTLEHCTECLQMTNHRDNLCLKCKSTIPTVEEVLRDWPTETTEPELLVTLKQVVTDRLKARDLAHQKELEEAVKAERERERCQISNFKCSNHGLITPRPICPKCIPDTTDTGS